MLGPGTSQNCEQNKPDFKSSHLRQTIIVTRSEIFQSKNKNVPSSKKNDVFWNTLMKVSLCLPPQFSFESEPSLIMGLDLFPLPQCITKGREPVLNTSNMPSAPVLSNLSREGNSLKFLQDIPNPTDQGLLSEIQWKGN